MRLTIICLGALVLSGCDASSVRQTPASGVDDTGHVARPAPAEQSPSPTGGASGIKLEVPLLAIMLGSINNASKQVFRAGTSDARLSERDWTTIGAAAIDLVADATLITLPGSGPNDAEWVADPRWLTHAAAFQAAGLAVGRAAAKQDRDDLSRATALLAQACQTCHADFSSRLLTAPAN